MSDKPTQFTREELRQMTTEEILAAREAGQLDDLLAGKDPVEFIGARAKPGEGSWAIPVEGSKDQVVDHPSSPRFAVEGEAARDTVSREQLRTMSPTEIIQAYEDGRLDDLKRADR